MFSARVSCSRSTTTLFFCLRKFKDVGLGDGEAFDAELK